MLIIIIGASLLLYPFRKVNKGIVQEIVNDMISIGGDEVVDDSKELK